MGKLSATSIKATNKPGRYGDGDGLYLLVSPSGSKSWIVRAQKDGRRRDIGLGSASKVSLKAAREKAGLIRTQIEAGLDPVLERRKSAGIPTFSAAAALVHDEHKSGWRNGKHQDQWLSTLERYAFPFFGDLPVSEVQPPLVRDALAKIWLTKPETARRVRQRILTVIDWAVAKGYREWPLAMAAIDKALPRQSRKVRHHPSMHYGDIPAFVEKLRERESFGRLALEAALFTACRSGEVRGATWDELDLENALWVVPAERMKANEEFICPLNSGALRVFRRMQAFRQENSNLIFPGAKHNKAMSENTLVKVLRDMGFSVTAHGFRATFRTWVAEKTTFPIELARAQLAHKNPDKVDAAYQRGTMLDRRRKLVEAWGAFCDGQQNSGEEVVAEIS